MSPAGRPPRFPRWLLGRVIPNDARDTVMGDLEEVYRERVRARGAARARVWFWLQSVSFSGRFTLERLRDAALAVTSGGAPSWLDVKLGARMLRKSPLLTVSGCLAITTAIAIFASFSQFFDVMMDPGVTLPGGDRVWQSLLGGDPDPIGATVRLGDTPHTVVGIAPESFDFPLGQKFWVPTRLDARDYEPRTGPLVTLIGQLAPGRTIGEAEAELSQLHALAAGEHPETHALMRPVIVPFTRIYRQGGIDGLPTLLLAAIQSLFIVIMIVACVNVATLVFARNSARDSEIAVRGALGASRSRIVIVLKSLVLATVGAGVIGVIPALRPRARARGYGIRDRPVAPCDSVGSRRR